MYDIFGYILILAASPIGAVIALAILGTVFFVLYGWMKHKPAGADTSTTTGSVGAAHRQL